jgi:predicted transcriptional regulator
MSPEEIRDEMKRLRIHMADVARRHGCHTSVISRALAGKGTSWPVLETAQEMIQEKKGRKA